MGAGVRIWKETSSFILDQKMCGFTATSANATWTAMGIFTGGLRIKCSPMIGSNNESPVTRPLRLSIRGLGPVPSFKNGKCIGGLMRQPDGTWKGNPTLRTKPESKKWMDQAVNAIASMLSSESATRGFGTTPECLKRFATCLLPLDDGWQDLEIGSVKTILVEKGEEGCDIILEAV